MSDNLYRRNGTWYARVKVAGREYRRSLRTRSRAQAKQRRDAWVEDIKGAAHFGIERVSWEKAVLRYTTEVLPSNVRPGTAKRYLVSLRQLDPILRGKDISEITKGTVSQVIRERRKQKATNATIRRDLTAMSRVLAFCITEGWRDDNPAREYDRSVVRERRDPITLPPEDHIQAILDAAPDNYARALVFLRQTGLREEEGFGLEHSQVNLKTGEITLTRTKTNRPRVVTMSAKARGTLEGTPRHISSGYVFWHGKGKRYAQAASRFGAIRKAVNKKREARKLEPITFRVHDLRHLFAVEYLRAALTEKGANAEFEMSIYRLSKILGHTSVKTTEIYLDYVDVHSGAQKGAHIQRSGTAQGGGEGA